MLIYISKGLMDIPTEEWPRKSHLSHMICTDHAVFLWLVFFSRPFCRRPCSVIFHYGVIWNNDKCGVHCAVQEKRDGNVGSGLDLTHALYFFIASSPRFALIIFLLLFVGAKSPTSPTLIKIKCFSLTLSPETRTKDSQIKQSPFSNSPLKSFL